MYNIVIYFDVLSTDNLKISFEINTLPRKIIANNTMPLNKYWSILGRRIRSTYNTIVIIQFNTFNRIMHTIKFRLSIFFLIS